jgi:phytol kinase
LWEKSDVTAYARKLFHATGIVIVAIYWFTSVDRWVLAAVLTGCALVLGVFDRLRAKSPALQAFFLAQFRWIVADKDQKGWNGSTLYFTGCALTVWLFDKPTACAGILCLALGDSLAAVVGMSVSSPRVGNISAAGSTTCFIVTSGVCALFFDWPIAIAGGFTATALEAISGTKLDNLLIPVGTAAVLFVLA